MADVVARPPAGPKVREWARRHGFSDWMVARYVLIAERLAAQGAEVNVARFLEGLLRRPPRYLRANPLRTDAATLVERLRSRGFEVEPTDFDPNVMRVRLAPISAGATQEHLLGMSIPQDLASASAPLALAARPGDTVADLAAAPGVKALHVAGDLGHRGALVAVEPDPRRAKALRFTLERGGAVTAVVRQERGQDVPGAAWADRVLLDAPCTGEGTLPKDRERRHGRPEEIATLCALQSELVAAADRVLRPGGTLVYATCSFAPEENEGQVQRFVERGYAVEPLPFDRCGGAPVLPGVTDWPGLALDPAVARCGRFLPGLHPTLGFFVARLRKPVRAEGREEGEGT